MIIFNPLKLLLLTLFLLQFHIAICQKVVPIFGFLLGANANVAQKCDLSPIGNYSFFGGIKIRSNDDYGIDHRCLLSITNMNIRYNLTEFSVQGAKSFMNDHRVSVDISLLSSLSIGKKSALGLGIMLSGFAKSVFESEYGESVDKNLSIGMNINKANDDLKTQMVNYMPSMIMSFRTPAFKVFGKQTGFLFEIRQNLSKIYHNPIDLEYGTNQTKYTKTVNPCITVIQAGLFF
jgi:hypothetical protein